MPSHDTIAMPPPYLATLDARDRSRALEGLLNVAFGLSDASAYQAGNLKFRFDRGDAGAVICRVSFRHSEGGQFHQTTGQEFGERRDG